MIDNGSRHHSLDARCSVQANAALKSFESLLTVWRFLLGESASYQLAIVKSARWQPRPAGARGRASSTMVYRVSWWCLNPAVAFRPLSASAHSVLLTSGTLAPLDSFSAELGTTFHNLLEAGHVVEASQVWAGCVANSLAGASNNLAATDWLYARPLDQCSVRESGHSFVPGWSRGNCVRTGCQNPRRRPLLLPVLQSAG